MGYFHARLLMNLFQKIATAKRLKEQMLEAGHTVSITHGAGAGGKETTPHERDRILADFRQGIVFPTPPRK